MVEVAWLLSFPSKTLLWNKIGLKCGDDDDIEDDDDVCSSGNGSDGDGDLDGGNDE